MKYSLLLSALILALAAWLGWQGHGRFQQAQLRHESLVAQAQAAGLDPGRPTEKITGHANKRREEISAREAETRAVAEDLIGLTKEISGRETEEQTRRGHALLARILKLDQAQLKALVKEVGEAPGLDEQHRKDVVSIAIMMLGGDYPKAALEAYAASTELPGNSIIPRDNISSMLNRLANEDPLGAVDWLNRASEDHPGLIGAADKSAVLRGVARENPELALSLVKQFDLQSNPSIATTLAGSASTPEVRSLMLAGLRGMLEEEPDSGRRRELLNGMIFGFSFPVTAEGFTKGAGWIDSEFTPDEKRSFADKLLYQQIKDEPGEWLNWVGKSGSTEKLSGRVDEIFGGWATDDYEAAGAWIEAAPDGPLKVAAAKTYAETLASYQPEVASEWARSLPEGEGRQQALRAVRDGLASKDPAAAARFAEENGITE